MSQSYIPDRRLESDDSVMYLKASGQLKLGLVTETHNDFDEDSSDEEDDDERLPKGKIRLEWFPSGKESEVEEKKLILLDRSLMLGETVCRRSDPHRLGHVKAVNVEADALILPQKKWVIRGIKDHQLQFSTVFDSSSTGNAMTILFENWIGTLETVKHKLHIQLGNGKRCNIVVTPDSDLTDHTWKREPFCQFDSGQWYPGQPIKVPYRMLKKAVWLPNNEPSDKLSNKMEKHPDKLLKAKVEKVTTESLEVHWLSSIPNMADSLSPIVPPSGVISGPDIQKVKKMDMFEYQYAQMGDRINVSMDSELLEKTSLFTGWSKEFHHMLLKQGQVRVPRTTLTDSRDGKSRSSSAKALKSGTNAQVVSFFASDGLTVKDTSPDPHVNPSKPIQVSGKIDENETELDSAVSENKGSIGAANNVPDNSAALANSVPLLESFSSDFESESESSGEGVAVEVASSNRKAAGRTAIAARRSKNFRIGPGRRGSTSKKLSKSRSKPGPSGLQKSGVDKENKLAAEKEALLNDTFVAELIRVHSFITVLWQDGVIEKEIPSTMLSYGYSELDDHVFVAGEFVYKMVEHETQVDVNGCPVKTRWPEMGYGVIASVDGGQRTAVVNWFELKPYGEVVHLKNVPESMQTSDQDQAAAVSGPLLHDHDSLNSETLKTQSLNRLVPYLVKENEMVSVYDLVSRQQEYNLGCYVLRIDNFAKPNTPYVGQVINVSSYGKVTVKWITGEVEEVDPTEIINAMHEDDEPDFLPSLQYDEEDDRSTNGDSQMSLDDDNDAGCDAHDAGSYADDESSGWETESEEEVDKNGVKKETEKDEIDFDKILAKFDKFASHYELTAGFVRLAETFHPAITLYDHCMAKAFIRVLDGDFPFCSEIARISKVFAAIGSSLWKLTATPKAEVAAPRKDEESSQASGSESQQSSDTHHARTKHIFEKVIEIAELSSKLEADIRKCLGTSESTAILSAPVSVSQRLKTEEVIIDGCMRRFETNPKKFIACIEAAGFKLKPEVCSRESFETFLDNCTADAFPEMPVSRLLVHKYRVMFGLAADADVSSKLFDFSCAVEEHLNFDTRSPQRPGLQGVVDRVGFLYSWVTQSLFFVSPANIPELFSQDPQDTNVSKAKLDMCFKQLMQQEEYRNASQTVKDAINKFLSEESASDARSSKLEPHSQNRDGDGLVPLMQKVESAFKMAAAAMICQLDDKGSTEWGLDSDISRSPKTAEEISADISTDVAGGSKNFEVMESAPDSHRYFVSSFSPEMSKKAFMKAVRHEMFVLGSSLPGSIFVKAYENRMDLYSCMIVGPKGTPFYDGLFLFDILLKADYPNEPPAVFFRTFASEQMNPNLYQDGKVCVSLLGTWNGKESEMWNPGSNLLQVFVSIQGLILNAEPFFNEAGFEAKRALPDSAEKSRRYNENALLRNIESLINIARKVPSPFEKEIRHHLKTTGHSLADEIETWINDGADPGFPLQPCSKGFVLSMHSLIARFRKLIQQL